MKVPEGFRVRMRQPGDYEFYKGKQIVALIQKRNKNAWIWRLFEVPGPRKDGTIYMGWVGGVEYSLQLAINYLTDRVFNDYESKKLVND